MKAVLTLAILLALLLSGTGSGLTKREHYSVLTKGKKPAFEVTLVHDQSDSQTTRTYLIADAKGPLLRVVHTSDYGARSSVTDYELVRDSRDHAVLHVTLPFVSTTRQGVLAEIAKGGVSDRAVPISLEGPAKRSFHSDDKLWRGAAGDEHRQKAKGVLGKDLARALDEVRELAGLPMFADLNIEFVYLFEPDKLVHRSRTLMVATTPPDCAFDVKFGVPCK